MILIYQSFSLILLHKTDLSWTLNIYTHYLKWTILVYFYSIYFHEVHIQFSSLPNLIRLEHHPLSLLDCLPRFFQQIEDDAPGIKYKIRFSLLNVIIILQKLVVYYIYILYNTNNYYDNITKHKILLRDEKVNRERMVLLRMIWILMLLLQIEKWVLLG